MKRAVDHRVAQPQHLVVIPTAIFAASPKFARSIHVQLTISHFSMHSTLSGWWFGT